MWFCCIPLKSPARYYLFDILPENLLGYLQGKLRAWPVRFHWTLWICVIENWNKASLKDLKSRHDKNVSATIHIDMIWKENSLSAAFSNMLKQGPKSAEHIRWIEFCDALLKIIILSICAIVVLTQWRQLTHICIGKLNIIGSDNGLSPSRHQAIIWTNAVIFLIWPSGTNSSEMLIEIHTSSLRKMYLKMSSEKWHPFCLGLSVLRNDGNASIFCMFSSEIFSISRVKIWVVNHQWNLLWSWWLDSFTVSLHIPFDGQFAREYQWPLKIVAILNIH